ncbi:unnamed protein product [Protopolystoma xenopodis]|uniref:Uncharacterized protein n=1 Tax=Protopolystoma xenopodis TaxID=117903 RepID=A0A3S5BWG7_9PLAT|nr:unnamed protein product [Protopolystoma xenopodis]
MQVRSGVVVGPSEDLLLLLTSRERLAGASYRGALEHILFMPIISILFLSYSFLFRPPAWLQVPNCLTVSAVCTNPASEMSIWLPPAFLFTNLAQSIKSGIHIRRCTRQVDMRCGADIETPTSMATCCQGIEHSHLSLLGDASGFRVDTHRPVDKCLHLAERDSSSSPAGVAERTVQIDSVRPAQPVHARGH